MNWLKKTVLAGSIAALSLTASAQEETLQHNNNSPIEQTVKEQEPEIRGIYIPGWRSISKKNIEQYITLAKKENINTFVIDVKNANGEVFYDSQVSLADTIKAQASTAQGATREIPMNYWLLRAKEENITLYARHVMFRDRKLYNYNKELQLKERERWVDLRKEEVVQYNLDLIEETAQMGFEQIILDYIRFPEQGVEGLTKTERYEIIEDIVARAETICENYDVDLGVFVFGCVMWSPNCSPIGQDVHTLDDLADYVYPMVYPSHFHDNVFGPGKSNNYPYEAIDKACEHAHNKFEQKKIIPMLQSFWYEDSSNTKKQVNAIIDNNMTGFVFWNPSGNYKLIKGSIQPSNQ